MKKRIAWTLCAAFVSALAWYGCDNNEPVDPHPRSPELSVQIVSEVPNDTLGYFENDSVYFSVIILVADQYGRPYPGQLVAITLFDSNLGYIEFADPDLRDTTNSLGRVALFYHSYARSGTQIITASAAGYSDTRVIAFVEVARPEGFTLYSDRPHGTIYVAPDSVLAVNLSARFADVNGNPRSDFDGMFISSSATGGLLERFSVIANGEATSTWTFLNEYGTFQARIFGNWLDPFTLLPDTSG